MSADNGIKAYDHENAREAAQLAALLSRAFEATFAGELIPGILHNFANPLNGIMGRAQILQRRLNDILGKLENQFPDAAAAFQEPNGKLVSDVAAICRESDRFFNMFQDVSGKFYAIGSAEPERIDLSRLLAAELRFADYYLDFKHEIRKEVFLEEVPPEISGISAYYSLCFWALFRNAMERARKLPDKNLDVSVSHDEKHVIASLKYGGHALDQAEKKEVERILAGDAEGSDDLSPSLLCLGLRLLKRMGVQVDFRDTEGLHDITIRIPY